MSKHNIIASGLILFLIVGLWLIVGVRVFATGQQHDDCKVKVKKVCARPTVTPTSTVEVTPTDIPNPCEQEYELILWEVPNPCVTPTATPSATPTPEDPKAAEGLSDGRSSSPSNPPQCPDTAPTKTAANFHIYRNGEDVIAKWFPTEGNKAHIYYVNLNDSSDAHALRDIENDGYEDNIHLLGSKDWRFGLQQVNGCAGGPIVWVDDADTNGWTLFR